MKLTTLLTLWLSIVGVGLAPFAYATPHESKDFKWENKWNKWQDKWEKKYSEYKINGDGSKWDKWEDKWEKKNTEYFSKIQKSSGYVQNGAVQYSGNYTNGVSVPEPTSLILVVTSLAALGIVKRRTRRAN